ncbi:MAG: nucleotide exchange factor GrpE [Clostridia bacterium]
MSKANKDVSEKVDTKEENLNSDLADIQTKLEEQKKKTDEYYEYLQRTMAEFDNYKKRIAKDKETMYGNILSDVVEKILPILDNFEKANSAKCKDESFKEGTVMIYNQLTEMLANMGILELGKVGEEFDPYLHDAVMHIDDENFGEKVICEVFRKGYRINEDKVIRHAMVKVAN